MPRVQNETDKTNALMESREQVTFDIGKGRQEPCYRGLRGLGKSLYFTLCLVM